MRGTLTSSQTFVPRYRFIPAHAGNTGDKHPHSSAKTVHPRSCGEHSCPVLTDGAFYGSSPLMRGTLDARKARTHKCRFIPAHAGNTNKSRWTTYASAVHPRSCGEHVQVCVCGIGNDGSSPLMRGTPFRFSFSCAEPRFIPAHAGNTLILNHCF